MLKRIFAYRPFRAAPLFDGIDRALKQVQSTRLSTQLEIAVLQGIIHGLDQQEQILLESRRNLEE